ncbi:solute carrier family 2, facilitated glucose transporter member 8-like [Actinia tenebrosa]|uniref:Solute carrier family 2, facilitated glucose transporter member 8-like n=1 Tax=Actinia tenebrosa TaxID=6105 RepID=A0A6P8HK42_ACTTE|nr:solute carrier family 2, facilitated glucose transporter member 8-like [Actinia tenebrosa]
MIDADVAAASSSYGSGIEGLSRDTPLIQTGRRMTQSDNERVSRMVLATFVAALGPLSFGYCLGYSSSALLDLQNEEKQVKLDNNQGSWFGALIALGAALGSPLGGWTIEALGRKGTIMFSVIPFELGWLLISFAFNHWMLYFGRLITGIGVGMVSMTVPVYIAEMSSAKLRGMLGSVNQLAVTFGLVFAYCMGMLVKWRWLALIGAFPPAFLALFMFFMPETPRWSIGHNRRGDAMSAMRWLKGPGASVEEECYTIEATLDEQQAMSCSEFCKPSITKPLIISMAAMFFQQFCGINAVLFNCAAIFKEAGFENGKEVSVIVAAVQFIGTGCACLIVDRAGRKTLLWTTALVMTASLIALGFFFELAILKEGKEVAGLLDSIHHTVPVKEISWIAILSLILYNLAFSLAWGPVPWLLMSEIFPLKARGIASSISTLFNWSLAFAVTKTFVDFQNALTPPGTYWLYAGISFLAFLFVVLRVPETKGKSLEEIERLFDGGHRRIYEPIE